MSKIKDKEKFLKLMRERFNEATVAYDQTRKYGLDDLKFFAGDSDNLFQWPAGVLNSRKNRPSLTVNKLPQHVRQITNDQRQNRPAGKVIPVDDKSDIEVADIIRRYRDWETDRKSTRLNSSHSAKSRMPSSA